MDGQQVRSPLPNSVPSTRSVPAINASSVAATPVPRSLWVCRFHHHAGARPEVAAEPLDLVRVDIRRGHLHRGWQVDRDCLFRRRAPSAATAAQMSKAKSSSRENTLLFERGGACRNGRAPAVRSSANRARVVAPVAVALTVGPGSLPRRGWFLGATREALRDGHPPGCRLPVHGQVGVGDVASLRDDMAELDG